MRASVCALCEQSIGSYVCSPCIALEVSSSLPFDLRKPFENLQAMIDRAIPPARGGLEHCTKCMRLVNAPVCLNCYIMEINRWLLPKHERSARMLAKVAAKSQPVALGNPFGPAPRFIKLR